MGVGERKLFFLGGGGRYENIEPEPQGTKWNKKKKPGDAEEKEKASVLEQVKEGQSIALVAAMLTCVRVHQEQEEVKENREGNK